jgi:hypothetical protein
VHSLIGRRAKIVKYRESKNTIQIDLPKYGIKTRMQDVAEAYTEDSSATTFCGLQGWIHEENGASITLYTKCGWSKVDGAKGEKKENDLRGRVKTFYLYRFNGV